MLLPILVGILTVACGGGDTSVSSPVEPTPPVEPPPLTATMAPASATVAVGNSVVFAVTASGGAAGAQASWTCASSNTGIATASNTGAGCQATGVAAGGVTITAAVTKGNETVNVGAQLTVRPDPPDPPPAAFGTRANPAAVGDAIKYETDFFMFDGVGTLEITLRGVAEGESAMAIIERDFSDVRNIAGTHYVYVVADFRIKVLEQTNPDRPITIPLSWLNWTSWSGDTRYPYPYDLTQGGKTPIPTGSEWVARVPLIFHRERSTVLDDLAAYQYHPESEGRRGPDHGAWFIIRERLAP